MPETRTNFHFQGFNTKATGHFWLLLFCNLLAIVSVLNAQTLAKTGEANHPLRDFFGKKIARSFPNFQHTRQDSIISLLVSLQDTAQFRAKYGSRIKSSYTDYKCYVLEITTAELPSLLQDKRVSYVQLSQRSPQTEASVPGFDHSVVSAGLAWQRFPDATGQNIVVSIKENRFDTTDIDFRQRYSLTAFSSPKTDIHATYMASMIAGAGNSSRYGKGIAWKGGFTSTSFSSLLPEPLGYYQENKITIQNHSYGVGVESEYGADAAAYDESMWKDTTLMHVFSAGNAGAETPVFGKYAGLKGWANLTGSFKISKNSLAVAALDSFYQPEWRSSRGPANDGRVKPELAAYGEDGTSGAAALVSGTIALLQQKGRDILNGSIPSSALIKALLICGSDNTGAEGPDYITGYGILNIARSMEILAAKKFAGFSISAGEQKTIECFVPDHQSQLSVALAWIDSAAHPSAPSALVNDLDLQVVAPDGSVLRPWVLSSVPSNDSLSRPAVRGVDTINVVETITVKTPASGNYRIVVNGSRLKSAKQSFALAWNTISADSLEFTNPLNTQPADGSEGTVIRWNHSFAPGTTGRLLWKNLSTNELTVLQENVELDKRYFIWKPIATGIINNQLQMVVHGNTFSSDTFLLHNRLATKVGYICSDSILLYWSKIQGASAYQVYQLKDSFMRPLLTSFDTSVVVKKSQLAAPWLAVAPVLNNKEGNGNAFNYTLQGAGCYVSAFLADLNGDVTQLALRLGTSYGISKITFQKSVQAVFKDLRTLSPISGLRHTTDDSSLISGANIYRAAIFLQNGQVIFTQPETIIYTGNAPFILYPNPALVNTVVQFVTRNADIFQIRISDMMGRWVKSIPINNLQTPIDLRKMQRGVYIIQALGESGEVISSKKLVLF